MWSRSDDGGHVAESDDRRLNGRWAVHYHLRQCLCHVNLIFQMLGRSWPQDALFNFERCSCFKKDTEIEILLGKERVSLSHGTMI